MFVYIGIIFMVFIFVTLSLDKRIKADTGIAFLLIGVLSVFAGIRESTGYDYDAYLSHFDKAAQPFGITERCNGILNRDMNILSAFARRLSLLFISFCLSLPF